MQYQQVSHNLRYHILVLDEPHWKQLFSDRKRLKRRRSWDKGMAFVILETISPEFSVNAPGTAVAVKSHIMPLFCKCQTLHYHAQLGIAINNSNEKPKHEARSTCLLPPTWKIKKPLYIIEQSQCTFSKPRNCTSLKIQPRYDRQIEDANTL